jgi:hypothetical protein
MLDHKLKSLAKCQRCSFLGSTSATKKTSLSTTFSVLPAVGSLQRKTEMPKQLQARQGYRNSAHLQNQMGRTQSIPGANVIKRFCLVTGAVVSKLWGGVQVG